VALLQGIVVVGWDIFASVLVLFDVISTAVLVQLHDLQAGVTGGSEFLIHVLFL